MTRSKAKLTGPVNPPSDGNSSEALTDVSELTLLDSLSSLPRTPTEDQTLTAEQATRSRSQSRSRPPPNSPSRSRSPSHSSSQSDSTSSSDIFIPFPTKQNNMSSVATVECPHPKVPPTLTPGKVTPEVLHRWEKACREYFRVKNVGVNKQVESILSRLQDLCIADWAEANEATLTALKFPEFMERLRERALEKDWDRQIKLSILAAKQGERPFYEWACEMQTLMSSEVRMSDLGWF